MSMLAKILFTVIVTACVISGVQSFVKQTNVLPNHDCGCNGYVAKAIECIWPEPTCNQASQAFKNYVFYCTELNKFRDGKRNGSVASNFTRTITCDANLNMQRRIAENCGTKVPPSPRAFIAQQGLAPLIPFNATVPKVSPIDWTSLFLPVKDQQTCGSCWAFASVSLAEYWTRRKFGYGPPYFSEQRLVSCATGNSGCNGGWPMNAISWMEQNGNVLVNTMPYINATGVCPIGNMTNMKWTVNSTLEQYLPSFGSQGVVAPKGNCDRVKALLVFGPVQANVFANLAFMGYKNGTFDDPNCPSDGSINHAVMITAFIKDYEPGKDVFKVRNSWGTWWGNQGYIYIRADGNICGICSWPLYTAPFL